MTTPTPARPTVAGLSAAERDMLAESLRHQWEGGRHRFMTWGDLAERDKDRWRDEVDILPFAAILAARLAPFAELADEWAVLADYVDDPDSTADQRARSKAGVIGAAQLRALLSGEAGDE